MGRGYFLGALLCAWLMVSSLESWGAPVSGRYTGVLRHEGIKRDQLVKLDLIASREEGDTLFLKGILTLHFGNFANKEYVAYHFDEVRYHPQTQTLVFDQPDQPVTVIAETQGENQITGQFRSSYSGSLGKIILSADGEVKPEYPLIEPIWGEYRGLCGSALSGRKAETVVQLYTYRSSEGAGQVGNPFRAYKIKGFVGEHTESGCFTGDSKICVWGNIRTGAYNFYKNQLQIFNNYKNLNCTTEPEGLRCRGCDLLKRVSGETEEPRVLRPPTSLAAFPTTSAERPLPNGEARSLQGEYTGYVHHEFLDQYQLGSLNILTYHASPTSGSPAAPRMSALASLFFGDEQNLESISYRFDERAHPLPSGTPQFVLSHPNADVDAILEITSLGDGKVKGVWYSQVFGRVGTFEFAKAGPPRLPASAVKFETISGHFQGSQWEMSLMVGLGNSPPGTENPFAPLTFGGYATIPAIVPRKHLTGGSYDFYTGRLGLELGDETAFIGERSRSGQLALQKMNLSVTSLLPAFGLEAYRRLASRGE